MGDGKSNFSVDEALVAMGFGRFQVLVLAYAGMAWISEAMEMMLLSFVGPALASSWDLSSSQQALLTTAVFAGMLVGAYSWGIVSDRHGRRYVCHSISRPFRQQNKNCPFARKPIGSFGWMFV